MRAVERAYWISKIVKESKEALGSLRKIQKISQELQEVLPDVEVWETVLEMFHSTFNDRIFNLDDISMEEYLNFFREAIAKEADDKAAQLVVEVIQKYFDDLFVQNVARSSEDSFMPSALFMDVYEALYYGIQEVRMRRAHAEILYFRRMLNRVPEDAKSILILKLLLINVPNMRAWEMIFSELYCNARVTPLSKADIDAIISREFRATEDETSIPIAKLLFDNLMDYLFEEVAPGMYRATQLLEDVFTDIANAVYLLANPQFMAMVVHWTLYPMDEQDALPGFSG
ncbi:hypothetical protein [Thermococcus celericrescens]|nr:hypothetical protein [Thermococcus celericrescens]